MKEFLLEEFNLSKQNCLHRRVFSSNVLLTNPPQYAWICSNCGEVGVKPYPNTAHIDQNLYNYYTKLHSANRSQENLGKDSGINYEVKRHGKYIQLDILEMTNEEIMLKFSDLKESERILLVLELVNQLKQGTD